MSLSEHLATPAEEPAHLPAHPAQGPGEDGAQPETARVLAMCAHIGVLLTWTAAVFFSPVALFGFVIPLVIRSRRRADPFVRHHTAQAINIALTGVALLEAGKGLELLPGTSWLPQLLAILAVVRVFFEIAGAVRAHDGERFTFPFWIAFRFVGDHDHVRDGAPPLSLRTSIATSLAGSLAITLVVLPLIRGGPGVPLQTVQAVDASVPYCELEVTWRTGNSMEIAEQVNTAVVDSCDGLAANLTRNARGYFTAVVTETLEDVPDDAVCTVDGVTLLSDSTDNDLGQACLAIEDDLADLTPELQPGSKAR